MAPVAPSGPCGSQWPLRLSVAPVALSGTEFVSRPAGASIRGRFTQLDLDQRAVLFVLPADVEVTADSFQFRLSDPVGNSGPPQT